MKVLHVIPSLSPKHGGPSFAMPLMAQHLAQAGVEVDVATTDDDGPGCRLNVPLGQRIEQDGYGIFYFRKQTEFYKVSLPFKRWVEEHLRDYDIVHVHALFSFASNCAARNARQRQVPCIVRPLGVLNRWGRKNRRRWLKSLSLRFVEGPILRRATAMHYTSRQEQKEAEELGIRTRGFLIPMGIDLSPFHHMPDGNAFGERFPKIKGRSVIFSLSRIDPVKGLDLLIEAWAKIQNEESRKQKAEKWVLVVAGKGEASYERRLQEQAARLGLSDDIVWAGFLEGNDKLSALAAARLFVLPSHSENFGLVVAEALAGGVPVIASRGTPWEDLITYNCGWWVDNRPERLAEALREAMSLSDDERREMGKRGRELVKKKYSWPAIAEQMKAVYECVTGSAKR